MNVGEITDNLYGKASKGSPSFLIRLVLQELHGLRQ